MNAAPSEPVLDLADHGRRSDRLSPRACLATIATLSAASWAAILLGLHAAGVTR